MTEDGGVEIAVEHLVVQFRRIGADDASLDQRVGIPHPCENIAILGRVARNAVGGQPSVGDHRPPP